MRHAEVSRRLKLKALFEIFTCESCHVNVKRVSASQSCSTHQIHCWRSFLNFLPWSLLPVHTFAQNPENPLYTSSPAKDSFGSHRLITYLCGLLTPPHAMPLLALPNELLCHIAKYLDSQSQVYALLLSCRRLRHLLQRYLLFYNVRYLDGRALVWAAENDRRNLARRLLRMGVPSDALGWNCRGQWRGPLEAAAEAGHLQMTELLMKNGANLSCPGITMVRALFWALRMKHEEIAIYFFSKLKDPNSWIFVRVHDDRLTALQLACCQKLVRSARAFLELGADVDFRTGDSRTALFFVLKHSTHSDLPDGNSQDCTLELVKLLLDYGATRDSLSIAQSRLHPDVRVRSLVEGRSGLYPNVRVRDLVQGRRIRSLFAKFPQSLKLAAGGKRTTILLLRLQQR